LASPEPFFAVTAYAQHQYDIDLIDPSLYDLIVAADN
jgi:hypothetical protein